MSQCIISGINKLSTPNPQISLKLTNVVKAVPITQLSDDDFSQVITLSAILFLFLSPQSLDWWKIFSVWISFLSELPYDNVFGRVNFLI